MRDCVSAQAPLEVASEPEGAGGVMETNKIKRARYHGRKSKEERGERQVEKGRERGRDRGRGRGRETVRGSKGARKREREVRRRHKERVEGSGRL